MTVRFRFLAGTLVLGLLGLLSLLGATRAEASEQLVTDSATNCKLWDSRPTGHHSVSWNGACVGGWAEGPGTAQWQASGKPDATFTGFLAAGRAEGKGELKLSNGEHYTGEFRRGQRNGKGTITWANGRRYEGDWVNDQRSGHGTMTFANGDRFVGGFQHNLATEGEFITAAGEHRTARVAPDGSIHAAGAIGSAPASQPSGAPEPLSSAPTRPLTPPVPAAATQSSPPMATAPGAPIRLSPPTSLLPGSAAPMPAPVPRPLPPAPAAVAPMPQPVTSAPLVQTNGPTPLTPPPPSNNRPVPLTAPTPVTVPVISDSHVSCQAANGNLVRLDAATCRAIGGTPR